MTHDQIIAFHGHSCPGIAIGFRMANAALNFLSQTRAEDEELVAIVENDACGVDAVRCLTGCTFGKGNLIFKDYGKPVYTIYDRRTHSAVRVVFDEGKVPAPILEDRDEFTEWLLLAPDADVVSLEKVTVAEPEHAQIRVSVRCAFCGETVMETHTREFNGKLVCIPCAEELLSHAATVPG